MLLSSPDHRGATGPLLFRIGFGVEYVGEESITVKAGKFDALHFRFVSSPGLPQAHPAYDIWCTADGDYVFLKGVIGDYRKPDEAKPKSSAAKAKGGAKRGK